MNCLKCGYEFNAKNDREKYCMVCSKDIDFNAENKEKMKKILEMKKGFSRGNNSKKISDNKKKLDERGKMGGAGIFKRKSEG